MTGKLDNIVGDLSTFTTINFVKQEGGVITIALNFSEKCYGFGEICIKQVGDQVFVDSERTSKEHTAIIISRLLDGAIFDRETDPEKHRQYNNAMGVVACGCGCSYTK